MTEATDFEFCARFGHEKYTNLQMTNCALSGRGQGQVCNFYRATACNATHGIAVGILSVCLSVRQMRVL